LETKTVNVNGTYTPGTGKVGFSSVTVNVPASGYTNPVSAFSANSGQYYIVSKENGNEITGSSLTYTLGTLAATPTTVRLLNAAGTAAVDGTTPTYTIPLQTKSVSSNGTYTPDSGKVGFSSVTVSVPTGYMSPVSAFSASGGQYYIVSKDNGNEITGSSLNYQLGTLAASPTIVRLLNSAVDPRTAYEVVHHRELCRREAQLARNAARPQENGLNAGPAVFSRPDPRALSPQERKSLRRRAARWFTCSCVPPRKPP
jgi:hypothetical protein